MDRIERVDFAEGILRECLGSREFLDAVLRALDYDTKEDIFDYIIRVYDIDVEEAEKEWEEDDYEIY